MSDNKNTEGETRRNMLTVHQEMQAESSQRPSKESLKSWYTRKSLALQYHFPSACARQCDQVSVQ